MARPLIDNPKQNKHGGVALVTRVPADKREELVRIAKRRGETLTTTVNKALSQYVAADKRRGYRGIL